MKNLINNSIYFVLFLCFSNHCDSQNIATKSSINQHINSQKDSIWNPIQLADSLLFDGKEQYTFPKTNIKFTPPKTFRADSAGNIVHDWTGSSIQHTIVNTPYAKLIKSISKETFEKQGFIYINQQNLSTTQAIEGTLYIIRFTSNTVEYERMVYFIGKDSQTLWLSINYPVMMKSLLYEVFENSLLTIQL